MNYLQTEAMKIYIAINGYKTPKKVLKKLKKQDLSYLLINPPFKQITNDLNDFPEFHPLKTIIHDRKVYRDVTSEGKGVIESNNEKAKAEINSLMEELLYGN